MSKNLEDPFNITDTPITPKGRDGQDATVGCLVVRGGKLTEAEFDKIWGGDRRKLPSDEVTFEDAEGNVETSSPRKGTD